MYEEVGSKWKEECGVFGAFSHEEDVSTLTYLGLYANQHRGQESAGIAVSNGSWMDVTRDMGLVNEVFRHQVPHMANQYIAIGHVRYSTMGSDMFVNTQPLMANFSGGRISIANNGSLTNAAPLRREMEQNGTIFHTTVDSEIFINLIARSRKDTIEEKILETVDKTEGAYSLVIMTDSKLIAVRDPHGFHPLCLGKLDHGWVVSSESCALDLVGAEFVRDIAPGEMLVIDDNGLHEHRFADLPKKAGCGFEHIYFARTDSVIDGQSVHEARFNMGRILARESKLEGDIVISVPDSGTTAATGYAFESGIPFVEGLTKNRYVGRTFIQPTQEKRIMAVKLKLSAIEPAVKGKRVIMVDDSIVRGTTSANLVKMLRNAGATEVHMCISSPPILYPCCYGIDTAVRKELIAVTKSVEEIREFIGADSLHFISLEGLKESMGNSEHYCCACIDGNYPVEPKE